MTGGIDHLVIAADTLAQGAAWCESLLGVAPGPGGRHALMGTHNLLLAIASDEFPQAYLEVIAVDPDAPAPGRPRWFGLDRPSLQAALRQSPRLLHLVLRTTDLPAQRAGLAALGLDPGAPLALRREAPPGAPLAWRMLVRDDGDIACSGALPTLIEWQGRHPADMLPRSPVALRSVAVGRLPAPVAGRLAAIPGLRGLTFGTGGPALSAGFDTPGGLVTMDTE